MPTLCSYADLVDQLDGMTDAVVAAPPSHSKVGIHSSRCPSGLSTACCRHCCCWPWCLRLATPCAFQVSCVAAEAALARGGRQACKHPQRCAHRPTLAPGSGRRWPRTRRPSWRRSGRSGCVHWHMWNGALLVSWQGMACPGGGACRGRAGAAVAAPQQAFPALDRLKGAASYAQVCLRRHCRRSASGRRRQPRLSRRSWQRRATRDWRWRPRTPRRRRRQLPPLAPPRQQRHPSLRRRQLPLWRLRHHHRHRRRCSLRLRPRQHAAVWPRHVLQPRLRRPRCPPWLQRWQGRQTRPPQAHRCGAPRLRLHPQLRLLQQRRHPPARRRRRRARCRSRRSSTPQTPVSLGGVKAGVHWLPTSAGVLCSCHACTSVAAQLTDHCLPLLIPQTPSPR